MPANKQSIAGMARSYKGPLHQSHPGKTAGAYSTLPKDGSLE